MKKTNKKNDDNENNIAMGMCLGLAIGSVIKKDKDK